MSFLGLFDEDSDSFTNEDLFTNEDSFINDDNELENLMICESKEFNKRDLLQGLSLDTRTAVDLITFDNNTLPVGSITYKVHKYPGDVDIFEQVKICCSVETATSEFANFFKNLVLKLKNISGIFWGDFKSGIDFKLKPLDSDNLDSYLERNSEYLTNNDINDLRNSSDWRNEARQFYIIRWSPNDILEGSKLLKSGGILTLEESFTHDTTIKLDLWAPVNGNYTEVTNFYLLSWLDSDNNNNVLNPNSLGDRKESLQQDIENYSSYEHWKPLKLAKRMWNLALWEKNCEMAKRLAPLFSSDSASLSQIEGEIEVFRFMLEKIPIELIPLEKLREQTYRFKRRINDLNDIDENILKPEELFELIDYIADIMDEIEKELMDSKDYYNATNISKNELINKLQELEDIIHDIINIESGKWMEEIMEIKKPDAPVYILIDGVKKEITDENLKNLIINS